jgi:hypothetical protein
MRRCMRKKVVSISLMMVFALFVSGCTSVTTTPAGLSCTQYNHKGCYYFASNGKAVPCDIDEIGNNICKNTKGDFYFYYNGNTYSCASHVYCIGTKVSSSEPCSPKFVYNDLVNDGQAWKVVNRQTDQNTTQNAITINFSSTSATTVSVNIAASASINVGGSLDAVFASVYANVHAQINASVSKTVTTVVGNAVTVTIPAGETAYGIYGVSVQVTQGHLYQSNTCGSVKPDYGDVQTYVPLAAGWCVWLSGHTPCRVVQGS